MNVTSIISAIGNNNSIYPLMLRDCGIENPAKVYISRKENLKESKIMAKDATRERFIDEYVTSAVWLGGIPAVEYCADKIIKKKGFDSKVSMKLFKNEAVQGIDYNIQKFKNLAPEAVKDLEKVKANKKVFEKLIAGKFAAAIIIPTAMMGFVLPKLNFALTKKIKDDRKKVKTEQKGNKQVSFGSGFATMVANMNTVNKMAITDCGLTVGRVSTSRNKEEGYTNGFRMVGSMFLNYIAPKYIARGLDSVANNMYKINVDLDPLVLDSKKFIKAVKENTFELPKSESTKDMLDFLDTKPKSLFAQFAQKSGKVSYLKNGVRDPRKYVDIEGLAKFRNEFDTFVNSAKKSGNLEKFAKKAKFVKSANIIANVALSSVLLAVALPKVQYQFVKLITGKYSDPGLKD